VRSLARTSSAPTSAASSQPLAIALSSRAGSLSARAGEIDQLLQKLVDKGVLTAGEAQTIATETKEEIKKQNVQGKNEAIPQWIQNIKLSGDFRLLYQYDHSKKLTSSKTQTNEESRGRIRARVGLDAKVNDQITVGVGIATGSTDTTSKDASRSGNVTLAGGFAKKTIDLDYAYVQYAPTSWATIIAGRMRNPLWEPSDFIWDGNIRPEGGVVKLDKNISMKINKELGKLKEDMKNLGAFCDEIKKDITIKG